MFARIAAASLILICATCAESSAGVIVSVLNVSPNASGDVTQTQASVQSPSSAGTLSFTMTTFAPSEQDPLFGFAQYDLFEYGNLNANVTNPDGSIVNSTVQNYDLSISLQDTTLGNLGTIDLLGSGVGGTRAISTSNEANNTFINDDLSSLRVNGTTLFPGFDREVAQFSLAYGTGQFLNIELINPNPNNDDGNFQEGLRLDTYVSDTADFQLITASPTEQRLRGSAVPEPASWTAFAFAVVAAGLVGLRRRIRALPALSANAVG